MVVLQIEVLPLAGLRSRTCGKASLTEIPVVGKELLFVLRRVELEGVRAVIRSDAWRRARADQTQHGGHGVLPPLGEQGYSADYGTG